MATYPHYHQYSMRLVADDDGLKTDIENLISNNVVAPGSGVGYVVGNDSIWKGSITELLLYEYSGEDGKPYIYTYSITEAQIGSEALDISPVHGTEDTPVEYNGQTSQYLVKWKEQADGTWKFTNKAKETTEVWATKKWVDPNGETMTPPEGAAVTFELFADGVSTGKTVVLDGTTVEDQIAAIDADEDMSDEEKAAAKAALMDLKFGELTTAWKAEWKDLPKYKYEVINDTPDDSSEEPVKEPIEIQYTLKEKVTYLGYENLNPDGVENYGEIINRQLTFGLKIVKVDAENMETGLSGAKFQLTRKLPGESGFTKFEHDSFEVDEQNDNKKTGPFTVNSTEGIILEGLIPGEYQIEEKAAPNGYIISSQPYTFRLNANGSVTSTVVDNPLVILLLKNVDNPAGLQIGNEPGAALPSTGGPGTRPFTILGLLLIAGAGLLLLRIRRTI